MDQNLNERQLEAVRHSDGPLLIVAGAGSGKTRTLTSRLWHLVKSGVPPQNIIAITFTNKAAQEMRSRISNFQLPISNFQFPFIGTFHSLGARILKREAASFKRTSAFTIFDNDDSLSLIKKMMKSSDISKDQYNPMAIQNKISSVKNELLDAEEYLDRIALKIFGKYESALIKNNAFDFDDLIEKVVQLFERNRPALEKYRNQFKYILVDEYQDVNTAQYRFVKLLAEKHRNISVVGDDSQSIYRFRGSDFRNFLNFENDWPQAKVVKLEQNYRSTSNIITAASALIKNNKLQKPKDLWTENQAGELIKIVQTPDAEEEANFVCDKILSSNNELIANKRIRKFKMDSFFVDECSTAILYRTNAQSRAIEQALISADIPYQIFGGLKFYERKEIKDIVAALRLAANPRDEISAERLVKNFNKPIAENLLAHLPRLGKEFYPHTKRASLTKNAQGANARYGAGVKILELINFFLNTTNYFEYLDKNYKNAGERIENINELINFAGEFSSLSDFLERVSLLQSTDAPAKKTLVASGYTPCLPAGRLNPINLMTIHLAKGLEFDNVFVIGCGEGLIPHQMSYGSFDELEEERRLMYVAMTRAKKNLCLSFYNLPSRFLGEIPGELTEFINLNGASDKLTNEDDIYFE